MPELKQFNDTEIGKEVKILMDCFTGMDGGVSFFRLKTYIEYLESYPDENRNTDLKNKILSHFKTINFLISTLDKP